VRAVLVGPKWCEIRQTVFSWTTQKFAFNAKTAHSLKLRDPHVITVTGKAFYRRQSQQSRLELGLRCSVGFLRANDLDC
jgi:hypothetical protein